ncbi:MAG TPA: STAS domain-containing protein [Casimicrobiaceae bacterium]|nr:STAS domain-containing protein [Casimicrobiaceae bacterium]
MQFSSRRFADVVVARPEGKIDHPNAHRLEEALAPTLVDTTIAALICDFSDVGYISSMGLRVLMVAAKKLRADGNRIAVASLQPVVEEIFSIARFNHVLEVFPSVRDALQALSEPALRAYDASRP